MQFALFKYFKLNLCTYMVKFRTQNLSIPSLITHGTLLNIFNSSYNRHSLPR